MVEDKIKVITHLNDEIEVLKEQLEAIKIANQDLENQINQKKEELQSLQKEDED